MLLAQGAAPQAASPKPAATGTAGVTKAAPKTAPPKAPAAPAKAAPVALTTDDQKAVYGLGLMMYQQLGQFDLSPAELELVKRGLSDAAAGKPAVELDTTRPLIGALQGSRSVRVAEKQKAASQAYLMKAAAAPGAVKTATGLIYRDLRVGTGASPKAADTVKVNYRGTLTDGKEFDSSYKRNQPAQFPLSGVIKCWTEGVQKMKVGGKAQLVCPSDIAYGDRGNPSIPGGATLIFEIELLDVNPGGR